MVLMGCIVYKGIENQIFEHNYLKKRLKNNLIEK